MSASAVQIYEAGLRSGAAELITESGRELAMPVRRWVADATAADQELLNRCLGPTLDVGCGPGRLTAALQHRGVVTLGIDISPLAVRLTRARGGVAIQRDVFAGVPGERRWSTVLLADGNVGIGGDPIRLLLRCRQLLEPTGSVLLDLEPPGAGFSFERVRLGAAGIASGWFHWSWLGADAVAAVAEPAGFRVAELWCSHDRWQAELVATDRWPGSAMSGGDPG